MILNLDPTFKPLTEGLEGTCFDFPSGCEPHIKLGGIHRGTVAITCRIRSMNDFMRLLLCTDALKRLGLNDIHVFMPYLPFARQEIPQRPCFTVHGENNDFQTWDQCNDRQEQSGLLKTVYKDGKLVSEQSFEEIRARVQYSYLF